MEGFLLTGDGGGWEAEVDHLRAQLGAPRNPELFPPQFLKATFPRVGGRIVLYRQDSDLLGAGFLFPRGFQDGRRTFVVRFHPVDPAAAVDGEQVLRCTRVVLPGDEFVFYNPHQGQAYERTSWRVGEVEIGRPDGTEAAAIRDLQKAIWRGDPDLLYPVDIHSAAFGACASLVARQDGAVCGFVFGFRRFGTAALPAAWQRRVEGDLRVESQLLGVSPECRTQGIGFLLKSAQAEQCRREGIDLVHWTVDPLQYANAVLNFGKLRAVSFDFYPDYYPIRNALNQVPASRLEITWLVSTRRVAQALSEAAPAVRLDLSASSVIPQVNSGCGEARLDCSEPVIAIEVPADWTALQRDDRRMALRWRRATDALFAHYLGSAEGKYAITGVGHSGGRRYLLAERVEPGMLVRYAS